MKRKYSDSYVGWLERKLAKEWRLAGRLKPSDALLSILVKIVPTFVGERIAWRVLYAEEKNAAKRRYVAKPCPRCQTPAAELKWHYYSSPPHTWAELGGRAGWRTGCARCKRVVDFFVEKMN